MQPSAQNSSIMIKPSTDNLHNGNVKPELVENDDELEEDILPKSSRANYLVEILLQFLSIILIILFFPLSLFTIFVKVRHFERVVILRNGKLRSRKLYGPGLVFYMPCIDSLKYADLRIICCPIETQEALTKDALSVSIDAVLYYKIVDPVLAFIKVSDYKRSTRYIAATSFRNAIGTRVLSEVLHNKRVISDQVFERMKSVTHKWGVQILRVEIKDITLPLPLHKSMAAEAESSRLANAKINAANAEIESVRNLQIATEMLTENQWGMTLRYLQSLQTISGNQTHTIVVPFSMEMMKKFLK